MVWHQCFFGQIKVPKRMSHDQAEALAYIAWKGGCGIDEYKAGFVRWFRKLATQRPDLAAVHVFDVYPVDELRWLGEYRVSAYDELPSGKGDCGKC